MHFRQFLGFFPSQGQDVLKRMTRRIIDHDSTTLKNVKRWITIYNIDLVVDIETGDLELQAGWCYDGVDEPVKLRCRYSYRHLTQGARTQDWIQIREWDPPLRRLLNLDDFSIEEEAQIALLEIV